MDMLVDLETLSTRSDAAIIAIGAVLFDPLGPLLPDVDPRSLYAVNGGEFCVNHPVMLYIPVNFQSSIDAGLAVDGDTIAWWFQQSDEARQAVLGGCTLNLALAHLTRLWRKRNQDAPGFIWSHGESFDLPILQEAYRLLGNEQPWTHKEHSDTRTYYRVAARFGFQRTDDFAGRHHALCDAYARARDVQRASRSIWPDLFVSEGDISKESLEGSYGYR